MKAELEAIKQAIIEINRNILLLRTADNTIEQETALDDAASGINTFDAIIIHKLKREFEWQIE